MSKKVTLIKRCGRPDCTDPKCPYVIVENNRTFKKFVAQFNKRSKFNMFTMVGAIITFIFFALVFFGFMSMGLGF